MTPLEYFDAFAKAYKPYKRGSWCYEDGLIYRGLAMLHEATGEQRFLDHLLRLSDRQISPGGSLSGYRIDEFNIDNIMAGRCLFYLDQMTGNEKYMKVAALLADQLARHPRTEAGNYWHKQIYPHQVWLDGLYMGLPFQIEYGQVTDRPELVSDALEQLFRAMDLTATASGLYVHGYDESRQQSWADPETGQSPACWARALGWLAMALSDISALVGPEQTEQSGLGERTRSLFDRLMALQCQEGRWLQVIDMPDLSGNFPESSASAMITYAALRAGRTGLWPKGKAHGYQALQALYDEGLLTGADGVTRFEQMCHVAGLGGFSGVYRDGTPEYYLTEDIVADDSKGVGPLMMAHAESLRIKAAEAAGIKAAE
ncbi:glycoside hydrolase family 88/105 protein [Roseibium algae]|uniref:Glycoside hydrolase family 88 protein n=1 Tax=Roseibium algae TaxID=3123038 RepID=A0ABU8TKA0_9HYPH